MHVRNLGKLSVIAIASAVSSALITAATKIIMEKKPDPQKSSSEDDNSDDSKKPGSSGGKKGIYEKVADFLHDMKDQLPDISLPKPTPVLDNLSLSGVVRYLQEGKAKNIIVMAGAGISTSAGIPDFRSPGSGLYDNLAEYNLPHPQAIFEIGYFKENPEPFFKLAKELFPGKLKPTPCHYFIRLLHEKGMLLRVYTQNIDALEHVSGIPQDKILEAHGTFRLGHCTACGQEYDLKWMHSKITEAKIPHCETCEGVVKPDVVFFGEALPARFFAMVPQDFGVDCDLLIIMGTSLVVQPFASLIDRVGSRIPRLLINKEKAGRVRSSMRNTVFFGQFHFLQGDAVMRMLGLGGGMLYDDEDHNYRDVYWQGTCDDGCLQLAEMLGWKDELNDMIKREWSKIDAQGSPGTGTKNVSAANTPKAAGSSEP